MLENQVMRFVWVVYQTRCVSVSLPDTQCISNNGTIMVRVWFFFLSACLPSNLFLLKSAEIPLLEQQNYTAL